jgi:hypothetical protein
MKVVFIAGPFRAKEPWDIEKNVRRAEELELAVWRTGNAAICPHTNSRFFQGAANDSVWLEGYKEILSRCDAILLTPDWQESSGAVDEFQRALELDIPGFVAHLISTDPRVLPNRFLDFLKEENK